MDTLEKVSSETEVTYWEIVSHTRCAYRNGLTCGSLRSDHPRVNGPEGAHEFVQTEAFRRIASEEEFELVKQLAAVRGETFRTFLTTAKGRRPWDSPSEEGRLDVNGERWWACDGYPTWYRWDETEVGPQLRRKDSSVAWA